MEVWFCLLISQNSLYQGSIYRGVSVIICPQWIFWPLKCEPPFTMKMVFASVLLICSFEKKVLMRHRWVESPSSLQLPARMDDPQGTWKRLCHFSPGKTNKKKTSLTHISWDILKTKKCGKNITPGPTALSAPSATDSLWYINQR